MKRTPEQIEEIENMLAHFHGSETVYQETLTRGGLVYAEGVKYLAEACGAYWLIGTIASYQFTGAKCWKEDFQVWFLNTKNSKGRLVCDDGNGNILAVQNIPYTDFPLPEIKFYVERSSLDGEHTCQIIMLPSER